MPIEGFSDVPGLPRVGKIHLGVMMPNKNGEGVHPEQVDYFVCPVEIRKVLGDKPKVLNIQFPVDDPALFAPQFLKSYSLTHGLVCQGDGKTAIQKIDKKTGVIADKNTTDWERKSVTCDRTNCPVYQKGDCQPTMNLYFCLLSVPGVGVWQLDTRSKNSMKNINNTVEIIRELVGTVRWLPLQLSIKPRDVEPPGKKKMTVHVLVLSCPISIIDLQKLVPPNRRIEAPKEPDEEEPPEPGDEPEIVDNRPITETGTEKADTTTKTPGNANETAENTTDEQNKAWDEMGHQPEKTAPPWFAVKQEQIKELKDLYKMAAQFFKVEKNGRMVSMSSTDVIKALGYSSQWEIKESPWQCWLTLISSREG